MTHAEAMVYAAAYALAAERESQDPAYVAMGVVERLRGKPSAVRSARAMLAEFKAFGKEQP